MLSVVAMGMLLIGRRADRRHGSRGATPTIACRLHLSYTLPRPPPPPPPPSHLPPTPLSPRFTLFRRARRASQLTALRSTYYLRIPPAFTSLLTCYTKPCSTRSTAHKPIQTHENPLCTRPSNWLAVPTLLDALASPRSLVTRTFTLSLPLFSVDIPNPRRLLYLWLAMGSTM